MRFCEPQLALWFFILSILLSGCEKDETKNSSPAVKEKPEPALFTLLYPTQTNIDFSNTLTEGANTNILMYEYFYNGGGTATGDLNGDGLVDIYFTSNMSQNKLYLNKGGMKFKDITVQSGAGGREGPWKTGVTIVDINGDNKLDLYVSYSGTVKDENRTNQLFINGGNDENGVPKFIELAADYGLASAAYSNQAYFFDYDRDGDLDALLLNHNPQSLPILNEISTAEFLKKDDPQKGIRLLEQTEGRFADVTKLSGISGSALTYGLGAGVADLNEDGWPDIYISNDYAVPDYLYINNGNGTFTNRLQEYIGHTSQFSMGNDIADINNDGLPEIVTLDMLPEDNRRQKLLLAPDNYAKFDLNVRSGFYYQYMRNMLQLNNGNGTFSEVGQMAGISNTDWSWAALLADYDNDGWKDLLVTNGYLRDYTNLDFIRYMDDYVKSKGRLMREDVLDLVSNMPASNVTNYIFSSNQGNTFTNKTKAWGMARSSNSNGASFADLDNDGDLDVVVNNINEPAFIYQNESSKNPENRFLQIRLQGERLNSQGIGAKVTLWSNGKSQRIEQQPTRGYLSSVSPVIHFGLGKNIAIDSLTITWVSGKHQKLTDINPNQILDLQERNGKPANKKIKKPVTFFTETVSPVSHAQQKLTINDFKRQPLLIEQLSYVGPCMIKGDVNNDGLEDIYISGGGDQAAALYLQKKNQNFVLQSQPAFELDKQFQDGDAVFFDADNDGDLDLYAASAGYHQYSAEDKLLEDRLYLNNGKGQFEKSHDALPKMTGSKSCVRTNDINGDGYLDLFVGGRAVPGRYPESPVSYILINDGKGKFINQIKSLAPQLEKAGMVTDALWLDINQDKKDDLIIVGEWMPVSVFIHTGKSLEDHTDKYFEKEHRGWWNKISTGDFNKDGKPDLVAGNLGLNSQCKGSPQQPAELYYKDFDKNGSVDPILCFFIQGKSYPDVTRDELLDQIGSYRSRFTNYKSYADVTLNEIFSKGDLQDAGHLKADRMETTLFISDGQGRFAIAPLPDEVQFSPVHTVTVLDYNTDGNQDLLLCGNNSRTKLRLGKFDANYGVLLKGDGRGGFEYISQRQSGFKLKGDVRSVVALDKTLLFGVREQNITAYKLVQ